MDYQILRDISNWACASIILLFSTSCATKPENENFVHMNYNVVSKTTHYTINGRQFEHTCIDTFDCIVPILIEDKESMISVYFGDELCIYNVSKEFVRESCIELNEFDLYRNVSISLYFDEAFVYLCSFNSCYVFNRKGDMVYDGYSDFSERLQDTIGIYNVKLDTVFSFDNKIIVKYCLYGEIQSHCLTIYSDTIPVLNLKTQIENSEPDPL